MLMNQLEKIELPQSQAIQLMEQRKNVCGLCHYQVPLTKDRAYHLDYQTQTAIECAAAHITTLVSIGARNKIQPIHPAMVNVRKHTKRRGKLQGKIFLMRYFLFGL